ncbi:hypothetical protein LPJ64_003372 [Coemansia asiatica]|uniref:Uncharacterized protein n=1 Tax=Coemansia asiatica TaxID=1052880 RepID=A0A9W8CI90_9FUNG|nr:hypothetical protein LPJ64_003372 [Coemansia asiatica]
MQLVSKKALSLASIAFALSSICLANAQANNPQCGVSGAQKCGGNTYLLVCDHGYWTKLSDCPKGTACKDSSCVSTMSLDPEIYPSTSSETRASHSPHSHTSSSSFSSLTKSNSETTETGSTTFSKSDTDNDKTDSSDSDKDSSADSSSSSSSSSASSTVPLGLASSYLVAFAAVAVAVAVPALGFF